MSEEDKQVNTQNNEEEQDAAAADPDDEESADDVIEVDWDEPDYEGMIQRNVKNPLLIADAI